MSTDIYYIEVLGKALDVLDVFSQADKVRLSLQEISAQTKLNKNTVFRILFTLAEHGYVKKHEQSYELGVKLFDLSRSKLRRKDLVSAAGAHMDALRDQYGETVNLGVLDEGHIRYVDVRESMERFRLAERVGGSDPLHCTSLGKAFLAFLPFEEVRTLMKRYGMPRRTDTTLTTLSALKADLDKARKHGYALDAEESMEGAFCVGAPVLDANGRPIAALSISGPKVRFDEKRAREAGKTLILACSAIREAMGIHP